MHASLYSRLASCNVLDPNQSEVCPVDSTLNHLLPMMIHRIFQNFDCNPFLDFLSVYLGISKAYDGVWHDGLIYELK